LLVEESRFGGALAWMFGSGFPKPATTADKAIDKHLGAAGEREVVGPRRYADGPVGHRSSQDVYAQDDWTKSQNGSGNVETAPASEEAAAWAGWGFALKPAHEPILLARKPLDGSHAANLLAHGTGALNIGGCRVEAGERPLRVPDRRLANAVYGPGLGGSKASGTTVDGRWPANVLHDGSDEVLAAFPGRPGPWRRCTAATATSLENAYGAFLGNIDEAGSTFRGDSGSAARFFYSSKATDGERVYRCRQCGAHRLGKPRCGHRDSHGNLDLASHPTVKPVELMRWLVRMVCPPGGLVLDPFAGTGTTGAAAQHERCDALLIEQSRDYAADICIRLGLPLGELAPAPVRAPPASDHGPLFGAAEAAE
jgi:site-specific DNA-methyltransferase (adenine-specific)